MKAESTRQKAEGSKQNSLRVSAYCLLPTAFYFFPRLPVSVSPLGRALLVAALFVSAYASVRYWRSLDGRSSVIRYPLVTLRALTLVLVSCALAGVSVEYQSATGARVLLRSVNSVEDGTERGKNGTHSQDQARREAFAALQGKGFEIVEVDDESIAQTTRTDSSFMAGVMLTDGAMSATDARREVERTNRAAGGAPVFVVTNYPSGEEPRVALESVTMLGHAARGVPIAVRCTIHARGMRGRASLVTISDDAKVQASASVAWMSDDERQSVMLSVVPKVAGWIDYTAKVEAANSEVAPHLARPFTIYVEERQLRVLFFESQPTWEAKFIRRALEQSGLFEVDYFAQVSRAATVGVSEEAVEQNDEESSAEKQPTSPIKKKSEPRSAPEAKLRAALRGAVELNTYDCVIVGATENSLLSSAESARLREWVERRGGGLVVLGGNSFNGSIIAPGGKLYPLLPSEIVAQQLAPVGQDVSRGRPLEVEKLGGGMWLTPTEAGASGALAGYLSAGEGRATKADMLLAGQGLRLGGLRPGAIVLAVAGQANASGTSETGTALIAAMRYGAGRTLLFAPTDSWRIRTSASGNEDSAGGAFNALWQGIALWTAAGARPGVEMVLSDESPAEGSVLTAELRVRDASYTPVKIEKLSARLQPLTEDAGEDSLSAAQPREISFAPDAANSNVWRARFPLPARGRFVLEIGYAAGGKSGNLEKHFAVVVASPREVGAAFDTLSRISRQSGGETIEAADINSLSQRLAAIPSSTQSVPHTWELRTWWPLAFLVALLLSIEWFARRWWKVD
jgi:hypothetical protein